MRIGEHQTFCEYIHDTSSCKLAGFFLCAWKVDFLLKANLLQHWLSKGIALGNAQCPLDISPLRLGRQMSRYRDHDPIHAMHVNVDRINVFGSHLEFVFR